MSKSTAWGIATVSPAARDIAERAAGRAGVTLEEWLNQAISEHATSADVNNRVRAPVAGDSVDGPRSGGAVDGVFGPAVASRPFRTDGGSARDLQERLKASAGLAKQGARVSEDIAAGALKSIDALLASASALQAPGGEGTIREFPSFPTPIEAPKTQSVAGSDALGGLAAPNISASRPPTGSGPAAPRLFDLESAVSQIASRRRALDAHQAQEGLEPQRRGFRGSLDGSEQATRRLPPESPPGSVSPKNLTLAGDARPVERPTDASSDAVLEAASTPEDALRRGLRTLSAKLDALRREWSETSAADRDLASLHEQMDAVRRALPNLAPRQAVTALEAALGGLAERINGLGRNERCELDSASFERIADEVRKVLGAHDPKALAADLERQFQSLGVRLDALAGDMVSPAAIEPMRRQMEEVHDLIVAAATRSVRFERLEDLIAALSDRVERLAADPPSVDTAQMNDLLAPLRQQLENAAAPPVLASIERRLGEISGRLDRSPAAPDLHELDEAARRIDAALQQSQFATRRVEASLNTLNAKIEAAVAEPLAALMRNANAQLDAAEVRDPERRPIEQVLSEIVEKLDRIPASDAEKHLAALSSIDHELKSLQASIDGGVVTSVERLADELAQRLESRFAEQASMATVPEQFAQLGGRLDAMSRRLIEAEALERATRDLLEKLQEREAAVEPAQANADVAEQVSALRQERASAERRTEALLQGIQDVLDRLIDRFSVGDLDRSPLTGRPNREPERAFGATAVESLPAADLDHPAPRRSPIGPAPSREELALSREPEDEFLLEPGAGTPEHLKAADLAQAIGPRTNSAISAHIAAARRAAQSAVAENSEARPSFAWPRIEQNMRRAGRFYVQHKRSFLLAAALVLAVTAVARFMGAHGPLMQKSELEEPTEKAAIAQVVPPAAPQTVDTTPTGSIGQNRGTIENSSERRTASPDLSTAIPSGVPSALREAVLAGSPPAQYELAERLFDGRGLSQDQGAAAFWFERSATGGFPPAEFRLGALYQRGVGVQRDPVSAKRWYTAAARAGNARAAHNLGVMNAEPVGEKGDYVEAAKWFRRAADMGVRDSQFNLAVLYARGLGVEQDLRQAWLYFSLAAAQGDAEAGRKRDEVAQKMDPDALAAAADLLSKFKATAPDPVANDVAATAGNWGDKVQPAPNNAPPPSSRDAGSRSGS